MSIFIPFISGFIASVIGILPPGLINLTAAKVSLIDGKKRAMAFVLGALIVIFYQTYISVIFAQYINSHQDIIVLLRKIGLVIFIGISIYYLFFAKNPNFQPDDDFHIKSKRNRFFIGMLISAINFFPIPYYVLVSITLASYNLFVFDVVSIYSLVVGVVTGSFSVFYLYVLFFNKMKSKAEYFVNNMNKIIGIITGLIAVITLFNVIKIYF
jgi:threonine/homoserine/homoserine lactone efflux protein